LKINSTRINHCPHSESWLNFDRIDDPKKEGVELSEDIAIPKIICVEFNYTKKDQSDLIQQFIPVYLFLESELKLAYKKL